MALSVADFICNAGARSFFLGIGRRMIPLIRSHFLSFIPRSWSFHAVLWLLQLSDGTRSKFPMSFLSSFSRTVGVSSFCILHNRDRNALANIRRRSQRVPRLNIMSSLGICDFWTLIQMQHWHNRWRRLSNAWYGSVLHREGNEAQSILLWIGIRYIASRTRDQLQLKGTWRYVGLVVWGAPFIFLAACPAS